MTDDALYLVDLFNMQIGSLQHEMMERTTRHDKFDRFSYSAWAIAETLKAIAEYQGYVTVSTIRSILHVQATDYERYYNANPVRHSKFGHALWTIEYLLKLTGGYSYE